MTKNVRDQSLTEARRLNYPVNLNLPVLDEPLGLRNVADAGRRLLALYAVVSTSYGFSKEKALEWLHQEGLADSLMADEETYLTTVTTEAQNNAMQWQVEALWALAWAVGCHDSLDFSDSCSDAFVSMLPDLKAGASSETFLKGLVLREKDEVLEKSDLAYCLHWGAREASLSAKQIAGAVPESVIRERRRALEWLIGDDDWYEVALDT
jgi:hypothetical protein